MFLRLVSSFLGEACAEFHHHNLHDYLEEALNIRAVKWTPNIRHKTYSSQKLATLLLRIDTAICRVGEMHSENAQVHPHSYFFIALEVSVV